MKIEIVPGLRAFAAGTLLFLAAATLHAQVQGEGQAGFHLIGARTEASHYSVGTPNGAFAPPGLFGPDFGFGGSAAFQYDVPGPRTNFSAHYTSTYSGRYQYTQWNALTHRFALTLRHTYSPKLSFRGELIGNTYNLEQYQFDQLNSIDQPLGLDPYPNGAGLLFPPTSSVPLGPGSTAMPAVPPGLLLYGNQIATVSLAGRFRYRRSLRTTWFFDAIATRVQLLEANSSQLGSYLPPTTAVAAIFGMEHRLSPTTDLRTEFGSERTVSRLQDYYTHSATAAVGRFFGPRVYLKGRAGVAYITALHGSDSLPHGPQYLADGAIRFKTHDHIFTVSQRRTVGQVYLYGVRATTETAASWKWARPSRKYWLYGSFHYQTLHGDFVGATHDWIGQLGVARRLSTRTVARFEYSYLHYWTESVSPIPKFQQGIFRMIVDWRRAAVN